MSFISNLFKKKAGGSALGNLFRSIIPGGGSAVPTQYDVDKKDLTDAQFLAKYGTDKNGISPAGVSPTATQQQAQTGAANTPNPDGSIAWYKKKPWNIVLPVVVVLLTGGLIFLLVKGKKGGRRRY